MAQELEKRGHKVGSAGYFAALNDSGILRYVMRPQYSVRYEDCIKDVASMAGRAVRDVLDDLKTHAVMLSFMDSGDLSRLSDAIAQLERLCSVAGERLSDAADCRDYLHLSHRDTQLQSRASQRDLEDAMDILRGSGSYDLPHSRERIFEQAIRGDILPDEEALRFLDDLQGGNGSDQLHDLWRMRQFRNNPRDYEGRSGSAIGSERYIESMENVIFGGSFSSSDLTEGDYSYGDSLVKALQEYVYAFNDDVNLTPNDEYMIYENRLRMLDAADELSKVTYYSKSWLEGQLLKLRRLEDFNNEIIEFDTQGEVRARMAWENGKNVMYIEADVKFILLPGLDKGQFSTEKEEYERRVKHYIGNFKEWGGDYQVFDSQDLKVEVKINRDPVASDVAQILIGDVSAIRAFGWGGKNIFGWSPEGDKIMGLLDDYTPNAVAVHEFGHWLGLQDAYSYDNRDYIIPGALGKTLARTLFSPYYDVVGAISDLSDSVKYIDDYIYKKTHNGTSKYADHEIQGMFPLMGVPAGVYTEYSPDSIMSDSKNPHVTITDIQMIVLAFQTGQRQNYQQQFLGEEMSKGMR